MEIRYLLDLLRAHWRFIAILTVIATLGGLGATYILPQDYEASTKILIRPEKEMTFEQTTSKAMMDYPVSFNIPVESISETFAQIMTSETVATQVVDILRPDLRKHEPDPRWYMRAYHRLRDWAKTALKYAWDYARYGRVIEKDPYTRAIEDVHGGLSAKPVPDTYIFTLTATADSPALARDVANTAASVFIDYSRTARQKEEGTAAEFLSKSLGAVGVELNEARRELEHFRKRSNAASLEEELSLKLDALAGFERDMEESRKQLREVEAELAALNAQLAGESKEVHSTMTMERNPVLEELQADLAGYEIELAEMIKTYQPSYPEVKILRAKIQGAKQRIAEEVEQVRSVDTTILNPAHEEVRLKTLDRGVAHDALQARLGALQKTIGRYRRAIDDLAAHKRERSELTHRVSVIETNYSLVSREYEEARLAALQTISEIRILHPARAPFHQSGPIKAYYAGGGLAAGLVLALGLVLFIEYVDRRIRTPEDAESASGFSVLATVPHAVLPAGSAEWLGQPGGSTAGLSCRLLAGGRPSGSKSDDK